MNWSNSRFALAFASILLLAAQGMGCTEEAPQRMQVAEFEYAVPLDSESPWPKFRRTAMQSGRSPVLPIDTGAEPWSFPTGKGIFSTAVIDGDDNVYVGSANRVFYKLDENGNELWSVLTGEVVDSSALLDDRGVVYFGSGDGFLYALDRDDGSELWKFEAPDRSNEGAFITWFEGNVAIGLDGTLYVPNDNFCTYAVDRDDGTDRWCFLTQDQTWSLPALNPDTNQLFMGSNFPLAETIFGIAPSDGRSASVITSARWMRSSTTRRSRRSSIRRRCATPVINAPPSSSSSSRNTPSPMSNRRPASSSMSRSRS